MEKNQCKDLIAELEAAHASADVAIERLQQLLRNAEYEILVHKLRLAANQRTMRLLIALSALIDEAGEGREVFWERGLVSREQYDALVWEFQQIGKPAPLDGCEWTERHQAKKALLEIVREYRGH
jgi:hypothetical protein